MSLLAGNNTYKRLNALTAGTQLASTQGQLHTVSICVKGASSNVLTLYDGTSTSGTVIANIDTTANVGTLMFDVAYLTGLFCVIATGTPADVTITFQ